MKLWLDDIRDPDKFRPGEEWIWCRTNTELIRILMTVNPDYIESFAVDHDKSHLCWVDPKELTIHQDSGEMRIFQEFACDETYEAGVRAIAMWAQLHDKGNVPIEIITSNTAKISPYREILGNRFVITVNTGGCQRPA